MLPVLAADEGFGTFTIILMLVGLVMFSVIGGAGLAHMTQEKAEKKKK